MCVLSAKEMNFFVNKIGHRIPLDDYDSVDNYRRSYSSCGAYRITFFSKTCKYVVKIPYTTEGILMCERERDLFNNVLRGSKLEKYFAAFCEEVYICGNRCFVFEKIEGCGGVRFWRNTVPKDDYSELIKFLDDNDIMDLHSGNYGIKNNHVCFVDYAPS